MSKEERMKKKVEIQKKIFVQAGFVEQLGMKFIKDLNKGLQEDPFYSWLPVANRTRIIADARKIRRELMDLIKMLEENA